MEIFYFSGTGNSLHVARELGRRFPGAILIPIMTALRMEPVETRAEVAEMVETYQIPRSNGGFIAKHYPQPWDIQLPAERQKLIFKAFMDNGCRL